MAKVESMKHLLSIVHCLSRLLSCKYGPPQAHTYNNEITIILTLIIVISKSPQNVLIFISARKIKKYNIYFINIQLQRWIWDSDPFWWCCCSSGLLELQRSSACWERGKYHIRCPFLVQCYIRFFPTLPKIDFRDSTNLSIII